MHDRNQHEVLLQREETNPVLTPEDWPYPVNTVFDPGATLLPDGSTLLLCRVEDRTGISHLCDARSANGVDGWEIDPEPTLRPDLVHRPEELWGIEDPRITFVEEVGKDAQVGQVVLREVGEEGDAAQGLGNGLHHRAIVAEGSAPSSQAVGRALSMLHGAANTRPDFCR